jgi:hypothetical protein
MGAPGVQMLSDLGILSGLMYAKEEAKCYLIAVGTPFY